MKNLGMLVRSAFLFTLVLSHSALAVSMNFEGTFRGEGDYYNHLNLGGNSNPTKTFLGGRVLLRPDLVIDDHFSVRSQWNLLTSPTFTPDATVPLGVGQGGYILGDTAVKPFVLNRVWLEWTSDFGILRAGRMPFSWGYGLVYDAGDGIWDDFQSTLDRIDYRLTLGHLVGGLAYSKQRKGSVLGDDDDQVYYTAYIQYDNPESELEAGVLYERQSRSASQASAYTNTTSAGNSNPYFYNSNGATPTYLSQGTPWPSNDNLVDAYFRKTSGYFTFGGEVGWLSGSAFGKAGGEQQVNAIAAMGNITYEYHAVKAFIEFLYASGDGNLNADHMNGFVVLNRNRRPGVILGRELLGPYNGNNVAQGSLVVYGSPDSFSGVYYLRPGLRVEWTQSWATGVEVLVAQKAATAGDAANLGVEIDVGTDYSIYKNLDLGLTAGYLIPGNGLGISNPQGAFGVRTMAGIKF